MFVSWVSMSLVVEVGTCDEVPWGDFESAYDGFWGLIASFGWMSGVMRHEFDFFMCGFFVEGDDLDF